MCYLEYSYISVSYIFVLQSHNPTHDIILPHILLLDLCYIHFVCLMLVSASMY